MLDEASIGKKTNVNILCFWQKKKIQGMGKKNQ
jgi:hypothetical protein